MRQRLAIARAYAVQAAVPADGRAVRRARRADALAMQDLLLEVLQAEGKTVMLITHSVEEAIYLSSRIVVVTARPARIRRSSTCPSATRAPRSCTKTRDSANCARRSASW
jgi:NitT/TauT family transport system ATP-binding protein